MLPFDLSSLCYEHRLRSVTLISAKNQERTFKFLKGITNGTSNHHPDQALLNCVFRSQETEKTEAIESKLSKASKILDIERITAFPFEII